MPKPSELDLILSQKRREPICVVKDGDLAIVEAWLDDTVTASQIRAAKSWGGNNVKYWAATVLKAAYQKGKVVIKK